MAVNPSAKTTTPLIKNVPTAPFVIFDGAPVFGHQNGLVELTLTGRALGLKSDQTVGCDLVAVAHLRCSLQAAANLRDALDKALAMAAGTVDEAKH